MYYLVYGFFYLLSLLPWWLIYLISDGVYLLVYYIIGYRKEMVMNNLVIAFPEKTEEERKKIAKAFYHGLCDTFLETIKILSISEKELLRRITINQEALEPLYASGQKIQVLGGHFMNWEFANHCLALHSKIICIGVYMPLSVKSIDKIMYDMRSKFGTVLIPATTFKTSFLPYLEKSYLLLLAADQNPGDPAYGYWLDFFGKPTPFVTGPEKAAKANNTAIVYANYYRVKRGHYTCNLSLVTTAPQDWPTGAIMKEFKTLTEEAIRRNPESYLWSHNRWKHKWEARHKDRWMDDKSMPDYLKFKSQK